MTFTAGETLYFDKALKVRFVRALSTSEAIVQVGSDTRVVEAARLHREEA